MAGVRGPGESKRVAYSYATYTPPGMCMQYVFKAIAAPIVVGLADANAGWAKSKSRHTDKAPPIGVPVYWAGGKHGHVAYSIGGGRVRSTDWPTKGKVGDCTIDQLTRSWGLTYRGWTSDYAGLPIPGIGGGGFNAANLRLGRKSAEAQTFNARVWSWLGRNDPAWTKANAAAWKAESAGTFGPMSQRAMRQAYAVLNRRDAKAWPASETVKPAPAWPGPAFLRAIGCPKAPDGAPESAPWCERWESRPAGSHRGVWRSLTGAAPITPRGRKRGAHQDSGPSEAPPHEARRQRRAARPAATSECSGLSGCHLVNRLVNNLADTPYFETRLPSLRSPPK